MNGDRERVWDIDTVLKTIHQIPQTYNTILGNLKEDKTCQRIIRRKLNNYCEFGQICKTTIPGTRFGKVLFYTIPKDYHILIKSTRFGSEVYYFYIYKNLKKTQIFVKNGWMLKNGEWVEKTNMEFMEGDIMKWL